MSRSALRATPELAAGLRALAQRLKVSQRALYLSYYLDLIAAQGGEAAATVGVVANGRSARLSDPLGALGLFWYMAPFRHPVYKEDKASQIKGVQKALLEMEAYISYPLNRILSDHKQSSPFLATFNFVHFHHAADASQIAGVQILSQKIHDKFHFPFNLAVSVNPVDKGVEFGVDYDERYFGAREVEEMLTQYLRMLESEKLEIRN